MDNKIVHILIFTFCVIQHMHRHAHTHVLETYWRDFRVTALPHSWQLGVLCLLHRHVGELASFQARAYTLYCGNEPENLQFPSQFST